MQVVDACYYCGASRIKVRIARSSCCFNVMLSKEEEGETTRETTSVVDDDDDDDYPCLGAANVPAATTKIILTITEIRNDLKSNNYNQNAF